MTVGVCQMAAKTLNLLALQVYKSRIGIEIDKFLNFPTELVVITRLESSTQPMINIHILSEIAFPLLAFKIFFQT